MAARPSRWTEADLEELFDRSRESIRKLLRDAGSSPADFGLLLACARSLASSAHALARPQELVWALDVVVNATLASLKVIRSVAGHGVSAWCQRIESELGCTDINTPLTVDTWLEGFACTLILRDEGRRGLFMSIDAKPSGLEEEAPFLRDVPRFLVGQFGGGSHEKLRPELERMDREASSSRERMIASYLNGLRAAFERSESEAAEAFESLLEAHEAHWADRNNPIQLFSVHGTSLACFAYDQSLNLGASMETIADPLVKGLDPVTFGSSR